MTGSGAHAEICRLVVYGDSGVASGEWSGPCKDRKAYGNGVAQFADGGTYWGDSEGGRAHGRGEMVDADGDRYEGEFVGGRQHGVGSRSSPESGGRVIGRWHRGELVEVFESLASPESRDARWGGTGAQDGAVTEGAVRAALPAVRCKLEFAGMLLDWTGRCKDGKAEGEGQATAPDGSTYEGSASQGKPHGHGTVNADNGGYYQGGFRNGLQHDRALVRNAGGRLYQAGFRDGQQVGKAILAEGVDGNDPWKEESGQQVPWAQENKFAADSGSTGVDSVNSSTTDSDQEDDAGYLKAVRALNGEDGVVRVAIPDDEYTAALTELERRKLEFHLVTIENESRRRAEEAVRRSEDEAAEIRRADRDAEKSRQRAALEQKATEAWQSEREEAQGESERKLKASMEKSQKLIALQQRFSSAEALCDDIPEREFACWSNPDLTGLSEECSEKLRKLRQGEERARRACRRRAKSDYQSALQSLILSNHCSTARLSRPTKASFENSADVTVASQSSRTELKLSVFRRPRT